MVNAFGTRNLRRGYYLLICNVTRELTCLYPHGTKNTSLKEGICCFSTMRIMTFMTDYKKSSTDDNFIRLPIIKTIS